MAPSTTVSHVVNTTCSVTRSTIDAFINAICYNIVLGIIIGCINNTTDSVINSAVTVVYECRVGGSNGGQGIVSKVLICVFFLGYTSLECGCFPTRD